MEKAKSLAANEPLKAVEIYKTILDANDYRAEEAVYGLAECFKKLKNVSGLSDLVRSCQKLNLAKAKIQKLFKVLIDLFDEIPHSLDAQIGVVKDTIEWAITEKRFFLRQALETKLAALYLENKMYSEAISLIGTLLKDLKKLDDKNALMEVQLLESRVYYALRNMPKSKVNLLFLLYQGCINFCKNFCKCYLLPANHAGCFGFTVWNFTCGREGL
jgi:26S proteasome regulatory subunit N6